MGRALAWVSLLFFANPAALALGEMLKVPAGLVDPEDTRVTFEILPVEADGSLPETLLVYENLRFTVEQRSVAGRSYLRARHVIPVAGGEPIERIVFFVEEEQHLRMLGFHRLRRSITGVEGEAIVFDAGGWNPLRGSVSVVPPDTYTYLGLVLALAAVVEEPGPREFHLWVGPDQALPAEVFVGDLQALPALGSRVLARRLHVVPRNSGAPEATYWFGAASPHTPLQYVGPAEFAGSVEEAPQVRLRATSSAEHIHRALDPE